MKKTHFVIIAILVLAFILRTYRLDQVPPGLTWDEAALGYNAFSILKTARDEHGAFLPLIFKSFGDYKPGLYVYLAVPFVALLGLSEFSVRLPSVIAGTLSVLLIYLILKKYHHKLALLSALVLALQPYHIIYSRGAWETNLATTFYLSAIYFFQRYLDNLSLWPAALSAGLSFFAYQGAKITLPLIFISQLVINRRQVKITKSTIAPLLTGLLLALTFTIPTIFGAAGGRFTAKSYFSYIRPVTYSDFIKRIDPEPIIRQLFHNQTLDQFRAITYRYFNHLSPRLLFYEGDWQTHFAQIPGMGLLYLADTVFIALGIYFLAKLKNRSLNLLWFSLLIIAPLAAAPTLDDVSSIRAHLITVPLAILSAAGLTFLINQRSPIWRLLKTVLILAFLLELIFAFDNFFVHLPKQNYKYWLYGYRQIAQAVTKYPADKVVFTNRLGQPYIFYLFYSQYPPDKYQQADHFVPNDPDVGTVPILDNIHFQTFYLPGLYFQSNTLYIARPEDLDTSNVAPFNAKLLEEIKAPNGELVFRVVKTNEK